MPSLGPIDSMYGVSDTIAEAQMCLYVLGDLGVGRVGIRGRESNDRGGFGTRPIHPLLEHGG